MNSATTNLASAAYMASDGPSLVWTQSGGGANIVVLTDQQIAVGVLPKKELKTAKKRLDDGEAIINVVGSKASYMHLSAVRMVKADLNGSTVSVEHSAGGIKKTEHLRFGDRDDQTEFMIEARDRLPQNVETCETQSNRWMHALKPFNLMVMLMVITAGVHTLFELELTDRQATRRKLDEWSRQSGPADNSLGARATRGAARKATVTVLAHNPAVMKVLAFAMIIVGILGLIFSSIGYIASMTLFGGATAFTFCWMASRLCIPPRSIQLVIPSLR